MLVSFILLALGIGHFFWMRGNVHPRFLWGWLHFESVLVSVGITLYIYYFASEQGYYKTLAADWRRLIVTYGSPVLSIFASLWSVSSLNQYPEHLWALSLFFGSFCLWDLILCCSAKQPNKNGARACEQQTRYWFLYVDFPTPLFFWFLFKLAQWQGLDATYFELGEEEVALLDVLMGGVIGFHMFASVWDWFWDCILARFHADQNESAIVVNA